MAELCKEAIDGWRNTQESFSKEIIPSISLASYHLGSLSEKERKEFEKKNPEFYNMVMQTIQKGKDLLLSKFCKNCKFNNNHEAIFCQKCGVKLK